METRAKRSWLNGFQIKWIAVISMIFDHFGSIVMDGVIAPYQNADGMLYFTDALPKYVYYAPGIKSFCSAAGAVGFPLFCLLISEGFTHTHNRLSYALRLLLFAVLSEIPYDLAHYGSFCSFKLQNVLFTLSIGVITLMLIAYIEKRFSSKAAIKWLLIALASALGMGAAFAVRSEYVFLGVLTIVLFYLLRDSRFRALSVLPLTVASPFVLLAAPAVYFYNGERGRGSKYFFYIFYPAHFLLFFGLARLFAAA